MRKERDPVEVLSSILVGSAILLFALLLLVTLARSAAAEHQQVVRRHVVHRVPVRRVPVLRPAFVVHPRVRQQGAPLYQHDRVPRMPYCHDYYQICWNRWR